MALFEWVRGSSNLVQTCIHHSSEKMQRGQGVTWSFGINNHFHDSAILYLFHLFYYCFHFNKDSKVFMSS